MLESSAALLYKRLFALCTSLRYQWISSPKTFRSFSSTPLSSAKDIPAPGALYNMQRLRRAVVHLKLYSDGLLGMIFCTHFWTDG